MTPREVAEAWYSVTDRWIVRRNKMHDERQWEVVHDWGGDIMSDETIRLIRRFGEQRQAEALARRLEDEARGNAVLRALGLTADSGHGG